KSPLPPAGVHRFSARALVSVDVSGRLLAKDRQVAGPGLVDLVARLGGTQLGRRPDPAVAGGEIVEILIPRAAYAEFTAGLGRLGDWRLETQGGSEEHTCELQSRSDHVFTLLLDK